MNLKGAGILYLLADRFQLYTNSLPEILEFRFNSSTVKHLNVINKDAFKREIIDFIKTHQLSPTNLVIVIADNAAFIKDIQPTEIALTEDDKQKQIQPFIDKNPYAHAVSKTLETANGTQVFATNQDLYLPIKEAFESEKFAIEYVLPGILFSQNISKETKLTFENTAIIFKEALEKKQDNLLPSNQETAKDKAQSKRDIMRLYAMVNVFGVLIIAVVVVWQVTHPAPSQDYRGKAAPNTTISAGQTLPNDQAAKLLTVEIIYTANLEDEAKQIQIALQQYPFQKITLTEPVVAIQTQNALFFSQKTPNSIREIVTATVKKSVPDVLMGKNMKTTADITIILGD